MVQKLPPLDARIPKWNLENLIMRDCPVCNSHDAAAVYERPDNLIIRICRTCNTFFVSPCPSEEELHSFYENYDENQRSGSRINTQELAASYKDLDPFSDLRIRELSSLMSFEASRVLDVGFGRGSFLYFLKTLGAIPFGLELDTQAIEFAKFLGIEVFQGDLADYSSETKFDLVTLMDLVEHPLNSLDIIRKSSELLQSGGLLSIWTPNGDFVRLDKSLTTFRVDLEHMQYFTPDTCLFIASALKLRTVHLETLGFPSLKGIDKPLSEKDALTPLIKKIGKRIPGFSMLNNFRRRLLSSKESERNGSYHLFCIMQKPAQ